jgi:hypothetical protein
MWHCDGRGMKSLRKLAKRETRGLSQPKPESLDYRGVGRYRSTYVTKYNNETDLSLGRYYHIVLCIEKTPHARMIDIFRGSLGRGYA